MNESAVLELGFSITTESLPTLPGPALEVIRLTQQEEVDLDRIGEAVGRDPLLAGRLLKLSNSPLFGCAREVTTINQALMVLGLKTVKMAAISFSMGAALGSHGGANPGSERALAGFWRRSVTAAVAARQLVAGSSRALADEAFLCGLLQDVGFAAMLHSGPTSYSKVVEALDAGHPERSLEQEALEGHTHAEVSAFILQSWDLPQLLILPVRHHHDPDLMPEDAPSEARQLVQQLNVAHDVATIVTSEGESAHAAREQARRKAEEWCGMSSQEFDRFLDGLTDHVHAMADVMDIDVGHHEEMAQRIRQAQEDMFAMAVDATHELERTRTRVEELKTRVERDALTGALNRAAFERHFADHWDRRASRRDSSPLALIMADIDYFKSVNDNHGHQAGDEVLREVARALERSCRDGDLVCRYGGEEFVIVLPGLTFDDLRPAAERLRSAVEAAAITTPAGGTLRVTSSFGAAWVGSVPPNLSSDRLLALADRNLYAAKHAGRNRAVIAHFAAPGSERSSSGLVSPSR